MNVLVSGLIGSLLTIIVTMFIVPRTNKKALSDSLDSKSEWRKSLFQAVSREEITMSDVYLLRASLRYKAHSHSEDIKINSNSYDFELTFDNITKMMIDFCEEMELNYPPNYRLKRNGIKRTLGKTDSKKLRIYLRYLLKAHWEWNLHPDSFIFKHEKSKAKVIREVLKQIEGVSKYE
ncbi:hypothetical protein [Lactococcus lactis]|uniref:hypothetical protein n=1 Tax=Lactococcus lactis TaxID=1358 RepID=UPI0022E85E00|nr:hypothetical protein [Lactococcus lactis]